MDKRGREREREGWRERDGERERGREDCGGEERREERVMALFCIQTILTYFNKQCWHYLFIFVMVSNNSVYSFRYKV